MQAIFGEPSRSEEIPLRSGLVTIVIEPTACSMQEIDAALAWASRTDAIRRTQPAPRLNVLCLQRYPLPAARLPHSVSGVSYKHVQCQRIQAQAPVESKGFPGTDPREREILYAVTHARA